MSGPAKQYCLFLGLDASFSPASTASSSYHVALLVLSAPDHFKRRDNVRNLRLEGFTLHFLFLIGHSNDITVEKMLEKVLACT